MGAVTSRLDPFHLQGKMPNVWRARGGKGQLKWGKNSDRMVGNDAIKEGGEALLDPLKSLANKKPGDPCGC